tara:strand:+ start:319 stop:1500 length:1182 start_codon:yes stop_codon:yes gene_type:complete
MDLIRKNEKIFVYLILSAIILLGFYLCFIGGYGSDEDTLPMIYVFEAKLHRGSFVSSRFTGNPLAELGIGFLSHFFGSFAANLFTYLFLLFGLIIFYFSFNKNKSLENLNFFIFLCLTSPILFFDNLEPVDYSWAFFFFSCGIFFLNKKLFELSVMFFAFSIGVRINYVLFVFITILFFQFDEKISLNRRLTIFLSSFIFGGLFYLPIWFENNFNLSWLTAGRPTDQGYIGLFSRFLYKVYISIGYVSSFVILIFFFKEFKKIHKIKNIKVLLLLCLSNLLIFLWIPAEFSYLQLFLVVLCLIIFSLNNKKFIYLICLGNLLSWFIFISPLKINHLDSEYCAPKNAVSASFKITMEKGFYFKYLDSRDKIKCWVYGNSERDIKILKGQALRLD